MAPAKSRPANKPVAPQREPARSTLQVVDPRWLIKALALTLLASIVCVYATLCLLVHLDSWQFLLHPSHTVDRTPASVGLDFSTVQFGAMETGQPRLTGWWVPAQNPSPSSAPNLQPAPKYAAYTVLYLHGGSGSLSDTVTLLALVHKAGLNIFAIDYRGFGASDASDHPSESRMIEDTGAAFAYLTSTRHIPDRNIVPYGTGLGAFLAANLAHSHPGVPAVVLDNPNPDPALAAAHTRAARILPMRLLLGKTFDINTLIATLSTPKLLIAGGPGASNPLPADSGLQTLFQLAASPRFVVTLPSGSSQQDYQDALDRFVDEYLPPR